MLAPVRDHGSSVFAATRAALRLRLDPKDRDHAAELDLRVATAHAGSNRVLYLPLIQFYQSQSRWADALARSTSALDLFPADFNLQIMHAKSLIHLGRAADAIAVLDTTRVLPSEGARESHQLFVQAHVIASLDAIDAKKLDDARTHLTAALEWPEHLGQGKPYEPEERLIRFVLARVDHSAGRTADAMAGYTAVIDATKPGAALPALDLLAIPSAKSLGARNASTRAILAAAARPATHKGIAELARALANGASLTGFATRYGTLFADIDAELVLRAVGAMGPGGRH